LSDYAETLLQQRFSTIDGVAQVSFWGQQRYAVRIPFNYPHFSRRLPHRSGCR
jgi:multidrug efflux pump subunit AcrB